MSTSTSVTEYACDGDTVTFAVPGLEADSVTISIGDSTLYDTAGNPLAPVDDAPLVHAQAGFEHNKILGDVAAVQAALGVGDTDTVKGSIHAAEDAVKLDVKAVKTDVKAVKTDVNAVKTDVATLDGKFVVLDSKFDANNKKVDEKLAALTELVQSLVARGGAAPAWPTCPSSFSRFIRGALSTSAALAKDANADTNEACASACLADNACYGYAWNASAEQCRLATAPFEVAFVDGYSRRWQAYKRKTGC